MKNINSLLMWAGFAFLVISIYQSWQVYQAYEHKIDAQNKINRNADQIRSTWNGLQPTVTAWKEMFDSNTAITSLYELNNLMNLDQTGADVNSALLYEAGAKEVLFSGKDIGLISRCVKNAPAGFTLSGQNLENVMMSLGYVEHRPDLDWGSMVFTHDEGEVKAVFDRLCVHLRVGGEAV